MRAPFFVLPVALQVVLEEPRHFFHRRPDKLDWQIVSCAESPGQAIIVLTAAPGSEADET